MADLNALPDENTVRTASELQIHDVKGNNVKFGTLFATQKTIVVFIRHFFCGTCQSFVEQLSTVSSESLDAAKTTIAIIGCGEWQPIKSYAEATKFTGPIYADPTRKLYHALGMTTESLDRTPSGEPKRSYIALSSFSNLVQSLWRGPIQHPSLIGKQGNFSQLGGDFIFGPGNECSFSSRMRHTEDHVEVAELMKEAGVSFS